MLHLFRRKPPVDPAALLSAALAVQAALLALEGYMEATADKRGLIMARKLHQALETAFMAHASAMGVDVQPLSGGVKPPRDD